MENRDAVLVRLPSSLKARIESCARANLRSATKEIQLAITNHVNTMQGKAS